MENLETKDLLQGRIIDDEVSNTNFNYMYVVSLVPTMQPSHCVICTLKPIYYTFIKYNIYVSIVSSNLYGLGILFLNTNIIYQGIWYNFRHLSTSIRTGESIRIIMIIQVNGLLPPSAPPPKRASGPPPCLDAGQTGQKMHRLFVTIVQCNVNMGRGNKLRQDVFKGGTEEKKYQVCITWWCFTACTLLLYGTLYIGTLSVCTLLVYNYGTLWVFLYIVSVHWLCIVHCICYFFFFFCSECFWVTLVVFLSCRLFHYFLLDVGRNLNIYYNYLHSLM